MTVWNVIHVATIEFEIREWYSYTKKTTLWILNHFFSSSLSFNNEEITYCACSCLNESSSSKKMSIQVFWTRCKFHAKYSENHSSSSQFVNRFADACFVTRVFFRSKQQRFNAFSKNVSSAKKTYEDLTRTFNS